MSILNPSAAAPVIPAANYNADNAIPSHTTQDTAALYWQNQITLAPQWKALIGARYDVYGQETRYDRKLATLSRTDKKFSSRAGLVWQPSDTRVVLRRTANRSSPRPRRLVLAANITAAEPEITQNKEIGVKLTCWAAAERDGRPVQPGAHQHQEHRPANPSRQINVGTQRTNGFELTASGRLPGRWDVSAGYAYLDGRTTKSLATTSSSQLPVVAVPALGKVPSLTPRNSASVW